MVKVIYARGRLGNFAMLKITLISIKRFFSILLLNYCYLKYLRAKPKFTLYNIRIKLAHWKSFKYHPKYKSAICKKQVVYKISAQQLVTNVPLEQVSISYPFQYIDIDYAELIQFKM